MTKNFLCLFSIKNVETIGRQP